MYLRKLAAAAGFATGAALAFAPLASADASSASASLIDSLISGLSPADVTPSVTDLQISFDGMDLFSTAGNEATAFTTAGQFGLAIAFGDGASATAEGGTGNFALASGIDALAKAGSTTAAATGNNFNIAEDIGNNTAGGDGAHDGAYAGAGSLIGAANSTGTDSNNTALDFGNNGPTGTGADEVGGNSGAFAGDAHLIGFAGAGSSDTAETFGNISGNNDGAAAVDGTGNFASISGSETGTNEGPFAGIGDNNAAIADENFTTSLTGVSADNGDSNIAYVDGPTNSSAFAGGAGDVASSSNTSYIVDPFGTTADSANAGGTTATGGNDLAEVFLTKGDALAEGPTPGLYDVLTPVGPFTNVPTATVDAVPGAVAALTTPAADPLTSTVDSEIASLNSLFTFDTSLAAVPTADITGGGTGVFETITTGRRVGRRDEPDV